MPAAVVNLYKPVGNSSANFVYRLRRVFGVRKVGHAGTLDPFADGVLIGCVGGATRLVERLMGLPKTYVSTLRLGVTNACHDPEQPFIPVDGATPPARDAVAAALARFVGEVEQRPPVFSAMKVGGVSIYKSARLGQAIDLPPRVVRIDRLDLLDYDWPRLRIEIRCGRGTYIRAIARDLGDALGCGACCETLTRTAVGPFDLATTIDITKSPLEAILAAALSADQVIELLAIGH